MGWNTDVVFASKYARRTALKAWYVRAGTALVHKEQYLAVGRHKLAIQFCDPVCENVGRHPCLSARRIVHKKRLHASKTSRLSGHPDHKQVTLFSASHVCRSRNQHPFFAPFVPNTVVFECPESSLVAANKKSAVSSAY